MAIFSLRTNKQAGQSISFKPRTGKVIRCFHLMIQRLFTTGIKIYTPGILLQVRRYNSPIYNPRPRAPIKHNKPVAGKSGREEEIEPKNQLQVPFRSSG